MNTEMKSRRDIVCDATEVTRANGMSGAASVTVIMTGEASMGSSHAATVAS